MGNQLLICSDIPHILDSAVKDISKRVVGISMQMVPGCHMEADDLYSLTVTTVGDYEMTLVMNAEHRTLQLMTERMKHGEEASDADIHIYMTEFYNILCGHIVSDLNRKNHSKARFGIPNIRRGFYELSTKQGQQFSQTYYYDCDYGTIKMEVLSDCG